MPGMHPVAAAVGSADIHLLPRLFIPTLHRRGGGLRLPPKHTALPSAAFAAVVAARLLRFFSGSEIERDHRAKISSTTAAPTPETYPRSRAATTAAWASSPERGSYRVHARHARRVGFVA